MEKRVLPKRSTRGQAPKLTKQEQQRDEKLYQQVFQKMQERGKVNQQQSKKKAYEKERHQMILKNIRDYPYSRGYHYYVELNTLPRLSESVSYVVDSQNIFNMHFKHDNNTTIGGTQLSKLLNRKFFGLPLFNQTRSGRKTQDKNQCHGYLFANQDKKYKIDLTIRQLKWILKNIDIINEKNLYKQYDALRRDFQLSAIFENDQLTFQDKKQMIQKRITVLQQRKIQMKTTVSNEDMTYFYHSLNQILHNEINSLEKKLSIDSLLSQLVCKQKILEDLYKQEGNDIKSKRIEVLKRIMCYHQSQKRLCVNQKIIQKLAHQNYKQRLLKWPIDQHVEYQNLQFEQQKVIIPIQIFDFANQVIFQRTQRVLANKMYQVNDSIFYICRSLWRKIFSRTIQLKDKDKFMKKQQYIDLANNQILKIKKSSVGSNSNGKQKISDEQLFKFPDLSDLIDQKVLQEDIKQDEQKRLFKHKGGIQLNTKQFICLNYFHWLYRSLGEFQKTGVPSSFNHQIVLGSEYYIKINHSLTQKIGTARFGIIEQILRKLSEIMSQQGHTMPFQILCQFNKQKKVLMIWIQNQNKDWQQIQQELQEQQRQLQDADQQEQNIEHHGQMIQQDQNQSQDQQQQQQEKQQQEDKEYQQFKSKPHKKRKHY